MRAFILIALSALLLAPTLCSADADSDADARAALALSLALRQQRSPVPPPAPPGTVVPSPRQDGGYCSPACTCGCRQGRPCTCGRPAKQSDNGVLPQCEEQAGSSRTRSLRIDAGRVGSQPLQYPEFQRQPVYVNCSPRG